MLVGKKNTCFFSQLNFPSTIKPMFFILSYKNVPMPCYIPTSENNKVALGSPQKLANSLNSFTHSILKYTSAD